MSIEYFVVKDLADPIAHGIVVSMEDGELETVAGKSFPSQFGCGIDCNGNLHISQGYIALNITEARAHMLKRDYFHWNLQGNSVVIDPSGMPAGSDDVKLNKISLRVS
ncbi:MAG: hypothetical protein Q8P81_01090 [Nanoarchaeota archaeon]|nr:hypothetical protein [Nanoarchaeota archaeon]